MSKSQIKNRFYLQIPYFLLQFEAKSTPTPSEAAVFKMNIDLLHSEPILTDCITMNKDHSQKF